MAEDGASEDMPPALNVFIDEGNALESLLQSCAYIRKRTRTCLTLSSTSEASIPKHSSTSRDTKNDDTDVEELNMWLRIREQQQTALNLDRQVHGYRSATMRLKRRRTAPQTSLSEAGRGQAKPETKNASQQHRFLRSKFMDATLRHQQEQLLLSRIAMSRPAVQVAFALPNNNQETEHRSGSDIKTTQQQILVQEAVKCCNRQVKIALETHGEIRKVKEQVSLETEKIQKAQARCRELWKELQALKQADQKSALLSVKDRRLAQENTILRRLLLDLISGCDLDWYNDERLRATLLKLENEC
jgi:hypothetical protein